VRLRVVILVYLALFVAELSWSGVTPLIPSYIDKYDLTDFQGGLVLSVASFGILVISIPASLVTRLVNARTLTLVSMGVIAVAGYAMAIAPGYWAIIAARLVFGLGFGTLYVAMAAWLADAAGDESPRVLSLTTAIVGVAATVSPAYAGWVAHHYTLSAPFVGLAAVTTLLFVMLLFDRSGTGLAKDPAPPVRELTRAATSDPGLSTMLLLTIAAATLWMTADLLVPLRLDAAGFDVGEIGLAFSVSAIVFVLSSAVTARYADRWARPRFAASWTAVLAAVTVVPAVLVGVPSTMFFLFGASVATGVVVSLTYPFGLYAVERGAVTVAVMSALANIIWALSGMAGPTVGGVFAEWAGDQIAFAVLALVSAAMVFAVLRVNRGESAAETVAQT
jgi:MFS family permease